VSRRVTAGLAVATAIALLAPGCGASDGGSDAVGELVVGREDGVYAIDLESGEERRLGSAAEYGGSWSPSGAKVATYDGSTLVVTTIATGARKRYEAREVRYGELEALEAPQCYSPVWSPDETMLACGYGEPWVVSTLDLETGDLRTLTEPSGYSDGPAWSPDSQSIAYVGLEGITVMDRDGGRKHRVASGHQNQQLGGPAWSPDGRRLAFFGDEGVSIVNAEGGKPSVLLETGGRATYGLAWSPDGRYLAVTHGDGDYELFLIDVDARESRNVTENERIHDREAFWSPDSRHIAYYSDGEGAHAVMVVPVEGGEPSRVLDLGRGPGRAEDRASILHWSAATETD
jgi:Tol biopolymer transport system component